MATSNYNAPIAFGAHIFIGDGTVVGGESASTPPAGWIYAGPARTITIEPQTQTHEWFVPCTGAKYRSDFQEWQTALDFRATIIYGGVLLWSLLLRNNSEIDPSSTLSSQILYVPLRDPNLRRWTQIQYYDTAGELHNVVNLWSHLSIESGPDLGDGGVEYEIMGRQLHSTLQAGNLEAVGA